MADKFFAVFDKGGAVKYSVEKSADTRIRVTVYYPTSLPENIEYDLAAGQFSEYEGHERRGIKTEPDDTKLKQEFLRIIGLFLDKNAPVELKSKGRTPVTPNEMREELECLVKRLK